MFCIPMLLVTYTDKSNDVRLFICSSKYVVKIIKNYIIL